MRNEMTFEQFYKALIKRWGIVVICFVCVGLGAYIGSSILLKPTYQSTVLVEVVVRSGGDPLLNDNILASQQLSETEANLATTYPVLSVVVSRYPGLTVDDLDKEVTATTRSNTSLFEITVLDRDPVRAANLANDIAATLIKQQLQLTQPTPTAAVPAQGVPAQATPTQNKAVQNNFLLVAQSARPAATPARPNKLLNTGGGLLIGLLLGALLAMLLDLLDTRVRTKESLVSLLDWSVLGTVRQIANKGGKAPLSNYSANADAYGTLRTNMGFVAMDKPLRTLVVTSGAPGEGKSLVATNLAMSMAKAGKNTLLIDANLRNPTQYEQFDIPVHAMGFSNAILAFRMQATNTSAYQQSSLPASHNGQSSPSANLLPLAPYIKTVNIPNLGVMPSGPLPPNPSELLDSKPMQRFFTAVEQSGVEVVIFDAPSVLGLSDALVLASRADGTLVVVDINRARKGDLKQVKELLEQARARVLGCVVNKQSKKSKDTPYKLVPYSIGWWNDRDNDNQEDERYATVASASPPTVLASPRPATSSSQGLAYSAASAPAKAATQRPTNSVTLEPATPQVSKQAEAPTELKQLEYNDVFDVVDSSEEEKVSEHERTDQTQTLPWVKKRKVSE
jgi:tyrosine-protein kinase